MFPSTVISMSVIKHERVLPQSESHVYEQYMR